MVHLVRQHMRSEACAPVSQPRPSSSLPHTCAAKLSLGGICFQRNRNVSHVQPPVLRKASAERMSSRLSSGPLLSSGRKGSSDDKEVRPLTICVAPQCSGVFRGTVRKEFEEARKDAAQVFSLWHPHYADCGRRLGLESLLCDTHCL